MKTHLLPPDVNWYRANMHCHSTHSDGTWTPERLKAEYKARGYSVLAITDHEKLIDHSDLNDPGFLTLTSTEYCVIDIDHPFPAPPEEKDPNGIRYCRVFHLNLFSKDPHPAGQPARDTIWGVQHGCFTGTPEEAEAKRVFSYDRINEVVKAANDAGFLVQYNHPNWSLNTREDSLALKGVWALEILNYATELLTGGEYCPYVYDDMLRKNGPSLFCTMGDDNHNRGDTDLQSFGGSTFIGAKNLDYASIMDALERGEFYCSSGREDPPRILALYLEDGEVHIDCTPAAHIFFVGHGRRFLAAHGDGITHASFPVRPHDRYFRIAVRDACGNTAHTHAYPADIR